MRQSEATLSSGQAWALSARLTRAGLDLDRVTAWTAKVFNVADLADLSPLQAARVVAKIPGWCEAVRNELAAAHEAAEERRAIQDADGCPLAIDDWLADYDAATNRQEATA